MTHSIALSHYADGRRSPRKRDTWNILRPILFGIGLTFALIPLFYTLSDREYLLALPIAVVIFVTHLALTIRTLTVAASIQTWGKTDEAWDVLAVTGMSAKRFIWSVWKATLRRVWLDHAVFSLLRLGLALGLSQLFYQTSTNCEAYGFGPLCRAAPWRGPAMPIQPEFMRFLITSITLAGFSVLEAALLTTLSLCVAFWLWKSGEGMRLGVSLLARAIVVVVTIGAWDTLSDLSWRVCAEWNCQPGSYCDSFYAYEPSTSPYQRVVDIERSDTLSASRVSTSAGAVYPLFAPTMIAVTSIGDNATLLSADMLRPADGILTLLRNIPQIIIGMALYCGIIRLMLWVTVRFAVRRGMLP